jgi:O-antigen ligase
MTVAASNRNEKIWNWLTVSWAVYYFVIFTIGTLPQYKSLALWGCGGLVGGWTLWVMIQRGGYRQVPQETILLVVFSGWSLLGGFVATDMALFSRIAKLTIEMVGIVFLLGTVLSYSGAVHWFFASFLGVAVWRTLTASQVLSGGASGLDYALLTSQGGAIAQRFFEANAVGVFAAVGVLSMAALLRETRNVWVKGLLVACGMLSVTGVVLSASRGAFITLMSISVLWAVFCLWGQRRIKLSAILGAGLVLWVSYELFQFILANTYLGTRFTSSISMEDQSTVARVGFIRIALRLLWENPVLGVGLGQFGIASGTGYYAHNEFAEIIATTGLPGFLLYYSVYWRAWSRLTWSLTILGDPSIRYRINMVRIALVTLLISGFLFRPNYQLQDTMFMIALVVGMAHWSERTARQTWRSYSAASVRAPTLWPAPGFGAVLPRVSALGKPRRTGVYS